MRSLIAAVLLPCLLALLTSACGVETFQDSISTRVEVPAQRTTELVTVNKRFRFQRDVNEASGANLYRAWIQVEAPATVDLSFISSVDVYVVDPVTDERVLAISGARFMPGHQRADLEIVLDGDLRRFVFDQRVVLEWEIMPNLLYRQIPTEETVSLRFGILLEIDT